MAENLKQSKYRESKFSKRFKELMSKQNDNDLKYDQNVTNFLHDILIIVVLTLILILVSRHYGIMEKIVYFVQSHKHWEIDEFIIVLVFWSICLTIFSIRRALELRKSQEILIEANNDLLAVMVEINKLKGILPICASCKKIRDDQGYWNEVESYIRDHSDADFSHGICPECAQKLYPNIKLNESAN